MGTYRNDPKGDIRHNSHKPSNGSKDISPQEHLTDTPLLHPVATNHRIITLLEQLTGWDHGYLKMRRGSDGPDLHLTWTWTLGPSTGSYVYARVNFWELEFGLDIITRKVFQVDEGLLKPTVDKRRVPPG